MHMISSRRYVVFAILVFITLFMLLLQNFARFSRSALIQPVPSPRIPIPSILNFPQDYYLVRSSETRWCQERFGTRYLENVRDFSASFCTDESTSQFTCFFSNTAASDPPRIDSMCYGRHAVFDKSLHRFRLGCNVRSLTSDERANGVPVVPDELTRYWYGTGPGTIMNESVLLDGAAPKDPSRITTILIKREGSNNIWHSLMEIMSLSWSLDVLQISTDIQTEERFLSPDAGAMTQIVLLDNHENGPFVDMWKLFSKMPIRRIHELNGSEPITDIIIPFAGGSNPLWQGDWEDILCRDSALVKTFVSRVLSLYGVSTPIKDNNKVIVTFIRRTNTRKLINEDAHIEALRKEIPNMILNVIDFGTIPFSEQIKLVRKTDLLVGVHGAGLTHLMFLQPGSAVLEILPEGFQHKGFRNLAQMLSISFFRAHAKMHGDASGDDQWQFDAVELDQQRLVDLVDFGVRSLYNSGRKSYDIL